MASSELEKLKEQARKDAQTARKQAGKSTAGGGSSELEKMKEQARADAAAAQAAPKGQYGGIAGIPGTGGLKRAGGGLLNVAVSALGMPQQALFRLTSAATEFDEGEGLSGALRELGKAGTEIASLGQAQGNIGFSEALTTEEGRQKGEIKKLPAGLETLANIGLDPLLFTGAGGAGRGRAAVKQLETVLGAPKAAEVAEKGVQVLTAAERAAAREAVKTQALAVSATGGRRSLREVAQGVARPSKLTAEEGAERVATKFEKGLTEIRTPGVVRKGIEGVVGASPIPKAVKALKTSNFGEWIDDALRPRAGIIRDYGKQVANSVYRMGGERMGRVAREAGDVMGEVQARIAPLGKLSIEGNRSLGAALRGEAGAVDALKGTDLEDLYTYLAKIDADDAAYYKATQKVKAPAEPLKKSKAALAVEPTAGGESFARAKFRELLASRGLTPEAVGAKAAPTAEQAATIAATKAAADAAAAAAKLKTTGQITGIEIGDNAVKDVLNRHFTRLAAQQTTNYAADVAKLTDPQTGESLVVLLEKGETPIAGWVTLKKGMFKDMAAPESVAKELDRIGELLSSDKAIRQFDRQLNRFDRFWKSQLTSLPVTAAFTLRNARSNVFLNWLDGLYTFAPYREATALQRAAGEVLKGRKFADDIRDLGVNAVLRRELSPRQYTILREAQKSRVVGANYFDIDLAVTGLAEAGRIKGVVEPTATGIRKVTRQLGTEGAAFDVGRKMNSAVEDNARLANFIHNIDRYGDPARAAEHTKTFLFDYSDLTAFEQRKLRKLVPFYTFMRKNVPLQIEQVMLQPGKIGARLRLGQEATEPLSEDAPSYLERAGARTLPEQALGVLGRAGGQVAFTPDTPLTAAAQTLSPVAGAIGAIPAIALGKAPAEMAAEIWRPIVSMLGGARGAPFKRLVEEASQRNLFTGAELPPDELRVRLLKTVIPAIGRAGSLSPKEKESIVQFLLRQAGIKTQNLK